MKPLGLGNQVCVGDSPHQFVFGLDDHSRLFFFYCFLCLLSHRNVVLIHANSAKSELSFKLCCFIFMITVFVYKHNADF